MTIALYALLLIIGYLSGCSSMSFYISKFKKVDIKGNGSKNYGASNTAMLVGMKAGVLVFIHDVVKSIIPVVIAKLFFKNLPYADVIAGSAAVLGHILPCYLKFNGGKGYASFIGLALILHPGFSVIAFLISVIIALLTDLVVASTFTMLLALPIYCLVIGNYVEALILFIVSLIIIIKHKENIKNIVTKNGKEGSIKATVFKRKNGKKND